MLARLRSNDRQQLANDIAKTKEEYLSLKKQLGFQIGHQVEDTRVFQKENKLKAVDSQIHAEAKINRPGCLCAITTGRNHIGLRKLSDN